MVTTRDDKEETCPHPPPRPAQGQIGQPIGRAVARSAPSLLAGPAAAFLRDTAEFGQTELLDDTAKQQVGIYGGRCTRHKFLQSVARHSAFGLRAAFLYESRYGAGTRQCGVWHWQVDPVLQYLDFCGFKRLAQKWRRGRDSNPRWSCPHAAFRVRCIRPLCHLSARSFRNAAGRHGRAYGIADTRPQLS